MSRKLISMAFYLLMISQIFSSDQVSREEFMQNGHKYAEMMGHLNDPVAKLEFMRNGGRINIKVHADHGNNPPPSAPPPPQQTDSSDPQQNITSNIHNVTDEFLKHLETNIDKNVININLTATNVPGSQIIINLCNENVTIYTGKPDVQNRPQND